MDKKIHTELKVNRRKIVDSARVLAQKLNAEIEKGNNTGPFLIALGVAIAKDSMDIILDLAVVGLIPGLGLVISTFVTTFLFFFMLGKGWFLSTRLRIWFWVLGLFIDGLPLFNALPMSTLIVLYAWKITKKRAEEGSVKLKRLNSLTRREVRKLNQIMYTMEMEG